MLDPPPDKMGARSEVPQVSGTNGIAGRWKSVSTQAVNLSFLIRSLSPAFIVSGTSSCGCCWCFGAARAAHWRTNHMGSTSDKVSGLANQAAGKVKEGIGKAIGDAKLETEGAAQDTKGKVQKGIGDAKGAIKDAVNKNL